MRAHYNKTITCNLPLVPSAAVTIIAVVYKINIPTCVEQQVDEKSLYSCFSTQHTVSRDKPVESTAQKSHYPPDNHHASHF